MFKNRGDFRLSGFEELRGVPSVSFFARPRYYCPERVYLPESVPILLQLAQSRHHVRPYLLVAALRSAGSAERFGQNSGARVARVGLMYHWILLPLPWSVETLAASWGGSRRGI